MNCKKCGTEIAENEKFCPNCGTAAEAASAPESVSAPTPEPVSAPTEPPVSPEQPPKKKKKTWKIVLIVILVVVLLVLILCGVCFGFAYSMIRKGNNHVDTYWDHYIHADTAEMTDSVPDAYWDYISANYGYSKEDCIEGLDYFFATLDTSLGGNLTYQYDTDSTELTIGVSGMETMAEVDDAAEKYGLSYTWGVSVSLDDAVVSGDSDSLSMDEVGICIVKIDGDWYDMTVMDDIDTICSEGYIEAALYQNLYGDTIQSYWTAFYNSDTDTMADLMPDALWTFLEENYSVDESGAKDCMSQYIESIKAYSSMTEDSYTFTVSVTGDDEYDISYIEDMNEYLGEDLTGDTYKEVSFEYALAGTEVIESDSSSSIMMQMDGTWYLFDGVYYFIDACYYYAAS